MELIRSSLEPVPETPMEPAGARAPAGRNPVTVYLIGLSPRTRVGAKQRLRRATELFTGAEVDIFTFEWPRLRYAHLVALRSKLAESNLCVGSANSVLSSVRSVLKEAWRLGLMDSESFHRAVDVKAIKGSTIARGRALEGGEVQSLFAACAADRGPAGDRDAGLLSVALAAGLRRQEIVDLDLEDFDESSGALLVRHGKGNKSRQTYLCRSAREILNFWLKRRGDQPGPLFGKCRKGAHGRIVIERLSTSAIYQLLSKRARQAGVKAFSPHDCRRTFCSELLSKGGDLVHVQRLMGHSSPSTTSQYDRRPEEQKRQAAELLVLPIYK